jgi:hypothetical protein
VVIDCRRSPTTATSCRLQWRVILDAIPVRYQRLADVRAVRVETTYEGSPGRSGSGAMRVGVKPYTLRIESGDRSVRAVLWGDDIELQRLAGPIQEFLVDRAQDSVRSVSKPEFAGVYRWVALGLFGFGALYWLYLPFQPRARS